MDAFETLGVGRSASIDNESLDGCFHDISKECHPDVNLGEAGKFEAVNTAYGMLKTVAGRLKHFRELEFPDVEAKRSAAMDPRLMDLFARIGPAIQRAEAVARQARDARSELAKALLADAVWEARDGLEIVGAAVAELLEELRDGLGEIDAKLAGGDRDGGLESLDRSYQAAAFLEKWQGQVREKLLGVMV